MRRVKTVGLVINKMKITGITLITKQEYEKNKSIIPSRDFNWIAIGSDDVIEFMGTTFLFKM